MVHAEAPCVYVDVYGHVYRHMYICMANLIPIALSDSRVALVSLHVERIVTSHVL